MINFIGKKNIFFIISGAIILLGLIFYFIFGGLNFGLDFTGGTSMSINMGKAFVEEDIKKLVDDTIGTDCTVQTIDETVAYIITSEIDTETRDKVVEAIKEEYGLTQDALQDVTNISASASLKLLTNALKAIGLAVLFMLIYITIRFTFRSGLAATLGLVHNVAVLLAVYAIFQISINTTFIAAILTIVGYSINDTIVIFDRIRENAKHNKGAFGEVANESLNQSLTRTLNTSLTTLFTITTLYVLGVTSIREFALPIIIGIIIGTYSSMCIATPIWVQFRKWAKKDNA